MKVKRTKHGLTIKLGEREAEILLAIMESIVGAWFGPRQVTMKLARKLRARQVIHRPGKYVTGELDATGDEDGVHIPSGKRRRPRDVSRQRWRAIRGYPEVGKEGSRAGNA